MAAFAREAGELTERLCTGGKLTDTGAGAILENMVTFVAARYALAMKQSQGQDGEPGTTWNHLRICCHDVLALQRGEQRAQRIELAHERLEFGREKMRAGMAMCLFNRRMAGKFPSVQQPSTKETPTSNIQPSTPNPAVAGLQRSFSIQHSEEGEVPSVQHPSTREIPSSNGQGATGVKTAGEHSTLNIQHSTPNLPEPNGGDEEHEEEKDMVIRVNPGVSGPRNFKSMDRVVRPAGDSASRTDWTTGGNFQLGGISPPDTAKRGIFEELLHSPHGRPDGVLPYFQPAQRPVIPIESSRESPGADLICVPN